MFAPAPHPSPINSSFNETISTDTSSYFPSSVLLGKH